MQEVFSFSCLLPSQLKELLTTFVWTTAAHRVRHRRRRRDRGWLHLNCVAANPQSGGLCAAYSYCSTTIPRRKIRCIALARCCIGWIVAAVANMSGIRQTSHIVEIRVEIRSERRSICHDKAQTVENAILYPTDFSLTSSNIRTQLSALLVLTYI